MTDFNTGGKPSRAHEQAAALHAQACERLMQSFEQSLRDAPTRGDETVAGAMEMMQKAHSGADGGGLRFNAGKNRLDLLPFDALEEVGKVLTAGSMKYAPRNWERGMPWSICLASLLRHVFRWAGGEDRDPESGRLHTAHVAANALFLTAYELRRVGADDRAVTARGEETGDETASG